MINCIVRMFNWNTNAGTSTIPFAPSASYPVVSRMQEFAISLHLMFIPLIQRNLMLNPISTIKHLFTKCMLYN